MAARSLGTLTLDLIARVGGFEKGMDRAQRTTRRASQQMQKDLDLARRAVGGLIGAMSVGAVGRFAQSQLKAADAVGKAADVANITTDSIQELRYAFGQLADVTDRDVDAALRRFNRRLGLAREGTGAANQEFQRLFGGTSQFQDTEAALDAVIQRIGSMEDSARAAAAASQFFGEDAGPALAAAIRQGEGAIESLRDEAQELGLVLDEDLIAKATAANDELSKAAQVLQARLAPAVSAVADGVLVLADNWDVVAKAAGILGLVVAGRLTRSLVGVAAQAALATKRSIDYQRSLGGLASRSYAAAAASTALRGALALIGGPAGVAILAAGAIASWAMTSRGASSDTDALKQRVDALTKSYAELREAELTQTIEDQTAAIAEQEEVIASLERRVLEEQALMGEASKFATEPLKEARAELENLTQDLEALYERQAEAQKQVSNQDGGSGLGVADTSKLDEYISKLRDQAAQLEINTQLEQTRYDIASGEIGELTAAQQIQLEQLAAEIDRKRELIEVEKEREQQRERMRDQILQAADAVRESGMTAEEREQERYQTQLSNLASLFENTEEYHALREEAELVHNERMAEIEQQRVEQQKAAMGSVYQEQLRMLAMMEAAASASGATQVGILTNAFSQITAAVAQQSRTMFEINKVAAIANATISTYQAAAQALKDVPYPLNFVAAAAVTAHGIAQVAAIQSTSFGGSSAPSVGGTPAPPTSPVGSDQQQQTQPQQRQRVYIEFVGGDDQQVSLRQLRQEMRRMQEDNPDAEFVY